MASYPSDDDKSRWDRPQETYHAHFDCFSGAAGDMMLASCLDAAGENRDKLLRHVVASLEEGMPELCGEFSIKAKRVWRGMGSIAAMYVSVESKYNHEAAPVPKPAITATMASVHDHHHDHGRGENEGSYNSQEVQEHNHEHSHSHSHSHAHQHTHAHQDSAATAKEATLAHSHSHAAASVDTQTETTSHSHEHSHATRWPTWIGRISRLPVVHLEIELKPRLS